MIVPNPHKEQRRPTRTALTIYVIERPSESYGEYHDRRLKEDDAEKVPFGFARALHAPDAD